MTIPVDRRFWIEALHNQNVALEKLLQVIQLLAQGQGKDVIVSAFRDALDENQVEIDNYIVFGSLALRFDDHDRFIDLFRVIEGTTKRAEFNIQDSPKP